MTIGGVLSEAWALYKRFFGRFFLTALIVFVVLDLLTGLIETLAGDGWGSQLLWGLVAAVVGIVGYFWVQAALVETVNDVRDGRADRSIGETYSAVRPRLPSVTIAGLLAGIGIGIGFILLIIPGLYLLTIWSMVIPVVVLENRSAGESFSRSQEIVRGHGWAILGCSLIVFIGIGIVEGLISALFPPLPDFFDSYLGSLVGHSITVPFAAAALTTAYFSLTRAAQEPAAAAPPYE